MVENRVFHLIPNVNTNLINNTNEKDYTNYNPNGIQISFSNTNNTDFVNDMVVPYFPSGQTFISHQRNDGDKGLVLNMSGNDLSTRYIKLRLNFGSIHDVHPTIRDGLCISWKGRNESIDLSQYFNKIRLVDVNETTNKYGENKYIDLLNGTVQYNETNGTSMDENSIIVDTSNAQIYGQKNGSYDISNNINLWDVNSWGNDSGDLWALEIQPKEVNDNGRLRGDMNNDGITDVVDIEFLASYLAYIPSIKSTASADNDFSFAADTNNDGNVNIADLTKLITNLQSS